MSGYVYILTNPSFKDNWVKIGKSSRPVNVRSKELDNTAVPLPFEIYAVMKTEKYSEAERQIHKMIDLVNPSMRIRKGREFFNVTPEIALSIFEQCALTLDDAEIEVSGNEHQSHIADAAAEQTAPNPTAAGQDSIPESMPSAPKSNNLTFKMLNIPVGSELVFAKDSTIKVHVANNINMVVLSDGTRVSLSKATKLTRGNLGTSTRSDTYQGGRYWLYNGERLISIRKRLGL